MTQETGSPSSEIKLLPIADMEKMSHSDLMTARLKAKTPQEQKHIAPYEHRAFAREYTEENPVLGAVGIAVAIPAYQAAKAIGLQGARTAPDGKQMTEAYKGIKEGLNKAIVEPWKRQWNSFTTPVPDKAPEPVIKPWERKWNIEPTDNSKKVVPTPPPGVKRNKAEQAMAEAVALTPAEQAQREIDMNSDQSLAEVEKELARKDIHALARNILTEERNRILEKRKKK